MRECRGAHRADLMRAMSCLRAACVNRTIMGQRYRREIRALQGPARTIFRVPMSPTQTLRAELGRSTCSMTAGRRE